MDLSTIKFDYNQFKSEYDADENNGKKGYEASITIGFDDKVINISSNQHNIIQPSSEIPEADWHVPMQENQI
ncbi:unnamed protein product [Brachionus calyciflorus]|uniref:Uncharacterized protein n=1 Tax=Brachionus calyciflorus TaxID=104777 RepID=A0A814A629_9BILA|nr:unnamed protein product [Brachionus calyciflorus]